VTLIEVDATTLIALGNAGRLDLLTVFDGRATIANVVASEVTTEPAASNLHALLNSGTVGISNPSNRFDETNEARDKAKELLGEDEITGDVAIIGNVIQQRRKDVAVAVVSDDRRVRRVAEGLGAEVTGTVGVIVRAVSEGELTKEGGNQLVERIDERGLHMTAQLRQRATQLIENAATDSG
jgi:predicted nucleic acid-binding protein